MLPQGGERGDLTDLSLEAPLPRKGGAVEARMQQAHFDIHESLQERAPALARALPSPLVRGLGALLHEREIDAFLRANPDVRGLPLVELMLRELRIDVECLGLEALDPGGRYLFVANHPNGAADGLAVLSALGRRFGDVAIVANSLLASLEPIEDLLVSVNKHGSQQRTDARALHDALLTDRPLVMFPAGEVSKLGAGGVADVPWRRSFTKMAQRSGRDIVPVFIDGRASWRFHALSVLRRTLRVRFHAEMLLLAHELDGMRGRRQRMFVKAPLSHAWLSAQTSEHIAAETRARVYSTSAGGSSSQAKHGERT